MADNAEVNSGSGITVATDQIGSAHYQLFKLADGTADSATPIPGDTAGLRVQFVGNSPALSGTAVVSTASGVGISGTAVATITGTALVSTASGVGISGTAVVTITGTALVSTASGIGVSGNVTVVLATGAVAQSGTALVVLTGGNVGVSGTAVATITGTALVTQASGFGISGTVLVNPVAISGTVLVNPVALSGSGTVIVAGDVAAAAADSGKPVKVGGVARITNPTAVTDAQRVNASFDDVGRQLVYIGQPRDLLSFQHTAVATAAETTAHVLGGAGVFLDLAELVLTNAASVAATVTIKDSFGGQTALIIELAPVGGIAKSFVRPIPQRSANQAWSITLDTAVTVYSTMLFEKNV